MQKTHIDLVETQNEIILLNAYMPSDNSVQTYMLNFIDTVGRAGFSVVNFSQTAMNLSTGEIGIDALLEGYTYPTDLLNTVESIKRLTSVSKLTFSKNMRSSDSGYSINLYMNIYNFPRNKR